MKETTLYICEICGTSYNNKEKCKKCEESHKKPKKIVKSKYVPYENDQKGYPHAIDVQMSDGEIVRYKRG